MKNGNLHRGVVLCVIAAVAIATKAQTRPVASGPASQATQPVSLLAVLEQSGRDIRKAMAANNGKQAVEVTTTLCRTYVLPGNAADALKLPDYRKLSALFEMAGDTASSGQLAKLWFANCESNPDISRLMTGMDWASLSKSLKAGGQTELLSRLGKHVSGTLEGKDGVARRLSIVNIGILEGVAADCGDKALAATLEKMRDSAAMKDGKFRKNLAPFEIAELAASFRRDNDKTSLGGLAQFLADEYLPQPGMMNALYPREMLDMAGLIDSSGNDAAKKTFVALLKQKIEKNHLRLGQYRPADIQSLLKLLPKESQVSLQEAVVIQWFGAQDYWAELDKSLRQDIASVICGVADGSAGPLADKLLDKWTKGQLTEPEAKITAVVLSRLIDKRKAKAWQEQVMKVIKSTDAAKRHDFELAAMILAWSGQQADKQVADQLADKLLALEDQSAAISDSTYRSVAGILDAKNNPFKDKMVAKDGRLNLTIVKTLAWMAKDDNRGDVFMYRLDAYKGSATEDALARWELARSYAMTLPRSSATARINNLERINAALSAAKSEDMRVQCLEEMASAGLSNGEVATPLQAIGSVTGQLSDASKARLKIWTQRLAARQALLEQQKTESQEGLNFRNAFDLNGSIQRAQLGGR